MFLWEQGIKVLITANGHLQKATWMQEFGYLILDPNPLFCGKDKRSSYFIPYLLSISVTPPRPPGTHFLPACSTTIAQNFAVATVRQDFGDGEKLEKVCLE